jgi:hypothetical protein
MRDTLARIDGLIERTEDAGDLEIARRSLAEMNEQRAIPLHEIEDELGL